MPFTEVYSGVSSRGAHLDQATQIKLAVAEAMAAHMGPLGIGWETWAIVLATFAGPVAAILVSALMTTKQEGRGRLRESRMWLFRTLLRTRGIAINVDHVAALNLVEIEFYKIEPVLAAWRNYMNHLNSVPGDHDMSPPEQAVFDDTRTDLLAKLLFQISGHLGFTMSEIDLKKGGYAPSGWAARDQQEHALKYTAIRLFSGQEALRVRPEASPPTA